ncbi:MAG: nitrate- and nitrite sensing domain-containing protein [Kineosporiaceae bacterium]|nr:nitrate- and nitrite sensing domain-containing protein [Kineosporiaceae bacterium]
MARHGSAIAEQPTPDAPIEVPRRVGGPATWPIRQKLIALAALPTAAVIGLVGFLVSQSFSTWQQTTKAQVDAEALIATNTYISAANAELQQTFALLLRSRGAGTELSNRRSTTNEALSALVTRLEQAPPGGWSPEVARQVAAVQQVGSSLLDAKPSTTEVRVRQLIDSQATLPAANPKRVGLATVSQGFDVLLEPARDLATALSAELAANTPNPRTVDTVSVLDALNGVNTSASQEMVLLTTALRDNRANPSQVNAIQQASAGQASLLDLAISRATDAQAARIASLRAQDVAIATARSIGVEVASDGDGTTNAGAEREALGFSVNAGKRLTSLGALVGSIAQDLADQTGSDRRAALLRLIFLSGLGITSLVLVSLLVSGLGRTITGPMRRLRSGAVDSATVRLPAAVRQIEREGPEAVVAVPPVLPLDARVGPETREVAQALDGLTAEAIRLATSQVRLRQSLDEAFVSMSRRSQSMVEKQLAIIDELESTEEDPEQLRNLFRLDHLAARMRRYNDNLLVLAGSAVRTRSAAPVAIADVFRAATSEMEQYERVRLQPLSGASVAGATAGGLIHLLAELLDNAAMYSPPTSPIVLAAAFTHDGGLKLEVTDSGVGIPPAELADLNARLAMPGTIDTQVPSRMGLYVVARLAQRGGFVVRLSARPQAAGTVAEVLVPRAQVLGAPTGPLDTIVPAAAPSAPLAQALESPRLPAQHSAPAATPMGGLTRPVRPAPRPDGPPVQPTPTHAAPPAAAGTSPGLTTTGLPSRRPGAALAGNPLGAAAGAAPAPTARATPPREAPAPARSPQAVPQGPPSSAPEGSGARNGAAAGLDAARRRADHAPGDLPRRTPGSNAGLGTPFMPPGTSAPANGSDSPGAFEPPAARRSSDGRDVPLSAPGRRPGARPLPVRAPGQPGGGPALGPSAATAVAAAASARPRPTAPLPDSGLFAAATRAPAEAAAAVTEQAPAAEARASADTATPDAGPEVLARAAAHPVAPPAAPPVAPAPTAPPSSAPSSAPGSGLGSALPKRTPGAAGSPPAPARPAADLPPTPLRPSGPAAMPAPPDSPSRPGQQPGTPLAPAAGPSIAPAASPARPAPSVPSPFEVEARAAAAESSARFVPPGSSNPLIGSTGATRAQTPIFDSISVWFSDDQTAHLSRAGEPAQVIDLRDGAARSSAPPATSPAPALPDERPASPNRWASLGDQRWIAANLRAAAPPEIAGNTTTGLPRRRPGANLLPSASAAAGAPTAATGGLARRTDAESVRGRLGSYQRGLSSARRARHLPPESGGLFHGGTEAGTGRQGGDS